MKQIGNHNGKKIYIEESNDNAIAFIGGLFLVGAVLYYLIENVVLPLFTALLYVGILALILAPIVFLVKYYDNKKAAQVAFEQSLEEEELLYKEAMFDHARNRAENSFREVQRETCHVGILTLPKSLDTIGDIVELNSGFPIIKDRKELLD